MLGLSSFLPRIVSFFRDMLGAAAAIETPLDGTLSMLVTFAGEWDHGQGVFQFGERSY